MSVAEHLGIKTSEYDAQILTFIPYYDEILDNAAAALDALDRPARTMVDLGTGSGALAARCLKRLKGARVIGIDSDVRNGYDDIKVTFHIDADASKKDIEALVAQSQKRSAVYDVITNPVTVTVEVA